MSEQQNINYQQQIIKPMIDDIIVKYYNGNALNDIIDFIVWLKENKINIKYETLTSWRAVYKSKRICHLKIRHGVLFVLFYSHESNSCNSECYHEFIVNDEYKKLLEDDKNIECSDAACGFYNPDTKTLSIIKHVIEKRIIK